MLKYVFKAVLEERADDMKFFAERVDKEAVSRLERFIDADFAQVDYTDAVTILENCGKQFENRLLGRGPLFRARALRLKNTSKRRSS